MPPRVIHWQGPSRIRAIQLWECGWGARKIRELMFREGWHPRQLPNEGQVTKILGREVGRPYKGTPRRQPPECTVPILDEPPDWNMGPDYDLPVVPMEPEARWLRAFKRCLECYGVSDGDHCPNGHPFPGNRDHTEPPHA